MSFRGMGLVSPLRVTERVSGLGWPMMAGETTKRVNAAYGHRMIRDRVDRVGRMKGMTTISYLEDNARRT